MSRKLVSIFFIYLVLEGALRKWFLPQFSVELFLLKDLLLLIALATCPFRQISKRFLGSLATGFLVVWIATFTMSFAITDLSLNSISGFRYYVVALPLVWLIPSYVTDLQTLHRAVAVYLLFAMATSILGVFQYVSPSDAAINRYAWGLSTDALSATFGIAEDESGAVDRVRITGSFSYIGPFAAYLNAVVCMAWVIAITANTRRRRYFGLSALVSAFVAIAMTGSRAPLLIAFIITLAFIPLMLRSSRSRGAIWATVVLIALAGVFSGRHLSDPFSAQYARQSSSDDSVDRVEGALLMPYFTAAQTSLLGDGIGATFVGVSELKGGGLAETIHNEVRHDRIGLEAGFLGYLVALIAKISFLLIAFRTWRIAATLDIRAWSLACIAIQASSLWQIPIYNAVASAFYFASVGLMFWLRRKNSELISFQQSSTRGAISLKAGGLKRRMHSLKNSIVSIRSGRGRTLLLPACE